MIAVAARQSPLSQAQTLEVLQEIRRIDPTINFETHLMTSHGDKDKKTSLRCLGKTDFFTREIDALVLSGVCRIAIHSAKDLPEVIPNGLSIIAITRGVDSADSLVLREGINPTDTMLVATSSERREEAVRQICPRATFIDVRGTIHERLHKITDGSVDGVVIAEAALIRLDLTHLYRLKLPGDTVQYQGQLAIIARHDDSEMHELFARIDSRVYA